MTPNPDSISRITIFPTSYHSTYWNEKTIWQDPSALHGNLFVSLHGGAAD